MAIQPANTKWTELDNPNLMTQMRMSQQILHNGLHHDISDSDGGGNRCMPLKIRIHAL